MNKEMFLEAVAFRFPGCRRGDIQGWIDFAEECVENEQFVDSVEVLKQKTAVEKWLESIYAGFLLVKERYGIEAAEEICSLSSLLCLHPNEMEAAAVFLKDGGSREKLPQMIEEGKLERTLALPKLGREETRRMKLLGGAEEYARQFDPFQEDRPPYVPKDGAALYFSRTYVVVDGKMAAFANRPGHCTMEEAREDPFVCSVCEGRKKEESVLVQIYNYVHPGKEPGRDVQEGEFGLVCMGALEYQTKEVLEKELSYEEAMEWAGKETETEIMSGEEEDHTAVLSF